MNPAYIQGDAYSHRSKLNFMTNFREIRNILLSKFEILLSNLQYYNAHRELKKVSSHYRSVRIRFLKQICINSTKEICHVSGFPLFFQNKN